MPRPFARSAAIAPSRAFRPIVAAHPTRRSGSHHARNLRQHVHVAVMLLLFAACGIACARPVAAPRSAMMSNADRFGRFVAEAALRFGIPPSWIKAVMQAESRGAVHAVSPKGAMGLMQIMPRTWAGLRSRYRLGADPFDPRDNILAGAAYLRELYDRYGAAGFLAAYNAGPSRYEAHLASGRPLPAQTQTYVAALAPLLREDGSAPDDFNTATIRLWTSSPFFPARADDAPGAGEPSSGDRPATDWTGLVPLSDGLFAPLSPRQSGL